MTKLSEIKGEAALDVLAEIIVPISDIAGDEDVKKLFQSKGKGKKLQAAALAIKRYKQQVIAVLAALEQQPAEEYLKSVNVLTLPLKLVEVLSDTAFMEVFTSAVQTEEQAQLPDASVPATAEISEKAE